MFDLAISRVDLVIVLVYMALAVLLGLWVGGRQRNVQGYFLGDRSLPWWALLLSIVATETSTVTFLSIPGVSYAAENGDFRFFQVAVGFVVGRMLVSWLVLPSYFRGKLFTSYEVLQQRFGESARRLASLLFMITRTVADALRLYLTAIVLREVIRLDLPTCIVIVGVTTIIYTFLGGMRSVVWNDCIQFVIYMIGAIWALCVLVGTLPAGWSTIAEFGATHDKFHLWDFSIDPTSQTMTFWIGLIGGAFLTMGTHGTDQLTVQRLLSARRQRDATWALIGSGIIVAAQFALFLLIGVGLACFYQAGEGAREFAAGDQVFATFIVEQMPRGVVGITLAAVFSAAMSTLSSSLNSSASAAVSDFYRPWAGANVSDARLLLVSRVATVLFGIGQMAIAMASERLLGGRSTVYQVLAIAGFTTGPILGLFFLAVWPKPISQRAALAGFTAGLVVLTCVAFQPWQAFGIQVYEINSFYYSFIGSTVTFLAGLAVSTFVSRGHA